MLLIWDWRKVSGSVDAFSEHLHIPFRTLYLSECFFLYLHDRFDHIQEGCILRPREEGDDAYEVARYWLITCPAVMMNKILLCTTLDTAFKRFSSHKRTSNPHHIFTCT